MKLPSLSLLLLLLFLSSSFLRPAAALCNPRSLPYDRLLSDFRPPPSDPSSARPQSLRYRIDPHSASPSPSPSSRPPPRAPLLRSSSSRQNKPSSSTPAGPSPHTPTPYGPLQVVADSVSSTINSLHNAFLDGSVESICEKTEYPNVCLATIQSVAPNLGRADVRTILKLMIKAAAARTRVGLEQGSVLHQNAKDNKSLRSILGVCTDGFEDALDDLKTAERYLDNNDKRSLIFSLGALFPDYGNCGDAFVDSKMESPMKAVEEHLFQVAGNCLSVAELI